jgi:hypothetical protein
MHLFGLGLRNGKGPPKGDKNTLVKATYWIRNDQNLALDEIRLKYISEGAPRNEVDKSGLVRKALDLLIKQEKI